MQMKSTEKMVSWVVLVSEISHVFCCVLPSLFTLFTFMVGIGMIGAMPFWMNGLHDIMHGYEIPMIIASAVMLCIGWAVHIISVKMDCRSTGCAHEPCKPQKKKNASLLKIASVLFLANISIYVFVHMKHDEAVHNASASSADNHAHNHHDHHGHDH